MDYATRTNNRDSSSANVTHLVVFCTKVDNLLPPGPFFSTIPVSHSESPKYKHLQAEAGRWLRVGFAGIVLIAFTCIFLSTASFAQSDDSTSSYTGLDYGSGIGLEVVVTNSGFGLGGYYSRAVDAQNSFLAELNIGTEKSEREVKFLGLNQSFIPDKANYFIRMPIQIGVQRRLWSEYIEDNFRPFLQVTAGPTLGWVYPYFDDDNGNGSFDSGERRYDGFGSIFKGDFRMGFGGTFGIGANFGENSRLSQGVRIAYSFNYFFETVQLLEIDDQFQPTRFFGTPAISITFGRLF